jgi:flagellar protein FliO/FliZ
MRKKIRKYLFSATLAGLFSIFSSSLLALDKKQLPSPAESLMPMLLGLAAILLVIFLLALVFKKFSNFGMSAKNIQVLETQMIGSKEKLVIVKVREQQFLIGVTSQSISQLGELEQTVSEDESEASLIDNALGDKQDLPTLDKINTGEKNNNFSSIITNLIKGDYPLIKAPSDSMHEQQKLRDAV